MAETPPQIQFRFQPGQTVIFLGDHTTPDNPGFVRLSKEILQRFYPDLRLNLISAGGKGQSVTALLSTTLMDLLLSSKPQWLAINLGLGDALREPDTRARYEQYVQRQSQLADEQDNPIGPEYQLDPSNLGPQSDVGRQLEPQLERLASFTANMTEAMQKLKQGGVQAVLFTTVVIGHDVNNPLNLALRAYSKAIRQLAEAENAPLVDVERAFRDVLDRATNYKQKISLTTQDGTVNPQGEALLARSFLQTFGVLPRPGFRPDR